MKLTAAQEARFWAKVDKRGPDECWPWTGERFRCGYGRVRIKWRKQSAHRVILSHVTGNEPPTNVYALHSCYNRLCVNPAHLRWGTAKDNTADRLARTHRPGQCANHGERNGKAKLTADDVRSIRAAARGGAALARKFGVSYATIKRIRRRDGWTSLA